MSKKDRFLNACRREPVDATPIWLMRQAGRYMPEYRALRSKHALLDMIRAPELAAEVTLQPVRAFDIDAAIIFADILPLLETLGLGLEFVKGHGPVLSNIIDSPERVNALDPKDPGEHLSSTLEAIRLVSKELDGTLPLIGFSGAPFTLACYAIEGGGSKEFLSARQFMYTHPDAWHTLMDHLATAVGLYLRAQAEAGANTLQLFDSWAGILSPAAYREYVQPHSQKAIALAREGNSVPFIHFATGSAGLLKDLKNAGGDVIGIDWRIDLADAWDALGDDVAVQGNLDPALLLADETVIRESAAAILDSVRGRPGHIFNLGHGIFKETPPEHVGALVDVVHEYSSNSDS